MVKLRLKKKYKNFKYNQHFTTKLRDDNYKCIDPETREDLEGCTLIRNHYIDIRTNYIVNELFKFQDFLFFDNLVYTDKYKNVIDKLSISKEKLEEYIIKMYNLIPK